MAIPITIALNFLVNSAKTTSGLNKVQTSFDMLTKTQSDIRLQFKKTFESMSNQSWQFYDKFNKASSTTIPSAINQFRALKDYIDKNITATFGKVPDAFRNMMTGIEVGKIEDAFKSTGETLQKFLGPSFTISGQKALAFMDSLVKLRLEGEQGKKVYENMTENFQKLGTVFKDKLKPKDLLAVQRIMENFAKSDKSVEQIKKFNAELDKLIKKKEAISQIKSKLSDFFYIFSAGNILAKIGFATALSDAIDAQNQMNETMQQMGMMANKTGNIFTNYGNRVKEFQSFTDQVMKLGMATSISMREATQAMSELATMRVVSTKDLNLMESMAETTVRMSQAFGMSTQEAAGFMKNLYVIGKLSKKEVEDTADAIANVQNQLGLTSQEASGVATQVGFMVRRMKAFGGTVKDVAVLAKNVAKLNVAFQMVGLEASQANDIINQMLDPSKIEDNVLLWRGLGMSVQDGMNLMMGDSKQLEGVTERMISMAKMLKEQYGQSPIALQEMAQAYGMTLEQVSALSSMTEEQIKMQKEDATLADQAAKARESMGKALDKIWNQLNVIMQAFIMPLLNLISPIIGAIADVIQWISTAIDKIPVLGAIAKFVLGAIILVLLMGIGKQITQVIPGIGGLGKAFSSVGNIAKNALSKITQGLGNVITNATKGQGVLGKLGEKLSGFGKSSKGIGAAAGKAGGSAGKGGGFLGKFFEALKGIDPKQLLALGAAILMIGAAIALIVASFALLASVMKELNMEQIIGLLISMAIIMGGMAVIIYIFMASLIALAPVAGVVGPILIPLGLAFLMIGLAIALVVASIALLVFAFTQMTDPQIIVGMVAMLGFLIALVPILAILGPIAALTAPGIFLLGLGFLFLGVGAVLVALSMGVVVGAFKTLNENINIISETFNKLSQIFTAFLPSVMSFAMAISIATLASLGLLNVAGLLIPALLLLTTASILFAILSLTSMGLAVNLSLIGNGLKMIVEYTNGAITALTSLKNAFDKLGNFGDGFANQINQIAEALVKISLLSPIMILIGAFMPKVAEAKATRSGGDMATGDALGNLENLVGKSNEFLERIDKNIAKLTNYMTNGGKSIAPEVAGMEVAGTT